MGALSVGDGRKRPIPSLLPSQNHYLKSYICTAGDITVDELKKIVVENMSVEKGEMIMTLGEQLINQGMEQGIQQGIRQGLLKAVELVLELKFGQSGLKLMDAVRQITDVNRLTQLADAIKTAGTISDFQKMVLQQPV